MTIKRMEGRLAALRGRKERFNADIGRRVGGLSREHGQAPAART